MPKTIRVELKGFSGDFDEAIGPGGIAIHGQIFGVTFDEAPDGRRDFTRTDIFSFPDGPLTIRNHQMTRVETSENYTLVNPTLDGSGVAPKQLEFGGRLFRADGSKFGEGFRIVTTFSPTPEGTRDTIVRVVNGNQEIKLHLFLEVTMSF